MWQFNILINYKYRKYLSYLKQNITNSPHCPKGVVFALVKVGSDVSLGIAMPEINIALLQSIRHWVAEIIVLSEKESLFSSFDISKKYMNTLIKTLMLIDISAEIEYCKEKLDMSEEVLCVHSYFNFRLPKLKQKWQANIKQKQSLDGSDEEQVLDIFKQVIATNQSYTLARITKTEDMWNLYIDDTLISSTSDELDIVASLIIHSPKAIEIYDSKHLSTDTMLLLQFLFCNKIKLQSATNK